MQTNQTTPNATQQNATTVATNPAQATIPTWEPSQPIQQQLVHWWSVSNPEPIWQATRWTQEISYDDIMKYGTDWIWKEPIYNPIANPTSEVWKEQQIDWMTYEQSLEHLKKTQEKEIVKWEFGTADDLIKNEASKKYEEFMNELNDLEKLIQDQNKSKEQQTISEPSSNIQSEIKQEEVKEDNDDWYVTLNYTVDEVEDAIKFKRMYENDITSVNEQKKKIIDYWMLQQENGILAEKVRDLAQENINLKHNTVALQDPLELSIVNSIRSFQESWSDNDQYAALKSASNLLHKITNGQINIDSTIGDYFASKLWVKQSGNYQPQVGKIPWIKELSWEDISKYWF